MPRGGRRPNSGRKPGSKNKLRSYAIIKAAFESGEAVPLDVMLGLMRHFWDKAQKQSSEDALKEAGMWAQAAAPYMHPRLNAIDSRVMSASGDTLAELLKAIDGVTTGIDPGWTPKQLN
jgi:hypothetical protein